MAKNPAVLFYTSDFLTSTTYLNFEEKGQLITLLCLQHQLGHIPEQHMLNICSTHDMTYVDTHVSTHVNTHVNTCDNRVLKLFKRDSNGDYYNERMEEEINKRSKYCKSRSNNRMSLKNDDICKTYDKTYVNSYENHMSLHMENENENTRLSRKNRKSHGVYRAFGHLVISQAEFDKLNLEYNKEKINTILDKIENHKNNKKYKSLFLTAKSWLKNAYPKKQGLFDREE